MYYSEALSRTCIYLNIQNVRVVTVEFYTDSKIRRIDKNDGFYKCFQNGSNKKLNHIR